MSATVASYWHSELLLLLLSDSCGRPRICPVITIRSSIDARAYTGRSHTALDIAPPLVVDHSCKISAQ